MRLFEIAHPSRPTAHQKWLSTVTLFVEENQWPILRAILKGMEPTEVTAVRPLCRFSGVSIDVLCQNPEEASYLIGKFYEETFKRVYQSAAEEEVQRARPRL